MSEITKMKNAIAQWNIKLSNDQYEKFMCFYENLIEWNKVMNLTAITEFEEVILKHFIDSLSLAKVINLDNELFILDIGTGAGFPGIPLKIAFPNLNITLLDSLNKRVNFLNHIIEKLKMTNISAIHGRAEDYGKQSEYREKFDFCVSRAVSNLATLSEYCIPFIKIGGSFISYKSGDINDEVKKSKNAIKVLGGRLSSIDTFNLPDSNIERSLVIIEKFKKTPFSYPRNVGKPSKEPIM